MMQECFFGGGGKYFMGGSAVGGMGDSGFWGARLGHLDFILSADWIAEQVY